MNHTAAWSEAGTVAEEIPSSAEEATKRAMMLVMKIIITFLSAAANTIGFCVLIYGRLYRRNMYLIILFITGADLISSLLHMPIAIAVSVRGVSVSQSSLCTINALTTSFFTDVVLLGQLYFNIDRYIAIQWPYRYIAKVTKRVICITWCVTAGCLFTLKAARILWRTSIIVFLPKYEICIDWIKNGYATRFRYAFEMAYNIGGYLVIFFTCYKVWRTARHHRRRIAAQDLVSGVQVHATDASTLRAFQGVLLTSISFACTGLPKILLLFVPMTCMPQEMIVAMLWLVNANGILNVLIYGYTFQGFRLACSKGLNCLLCSSPRGFRNNKVGVATVSNTKPVSAANTDVP